MHITKIFMSLFPHYNALDKERFREHVINFTKKMRGNNKVEKNRMLNCNIHIRIFSFYSILVNFGPLSNYSLLPPHPGVEPKYKTKSFVLTQGPPYNNFKSE